MPNPVRLPSPGQIRELNQAVSKMVAAGDGAGLLETFAHKTVPFLFLTADNIAGAVPLIKQAIGLRMGGLAPDWLPTDLLQLSQASLRWFLHREGYTNKDTELAIDARARIADVVERVTFVEDALGWREVRWVVDSPPGPAD